MPWKRGRNTDTPAWMDLEDYWRFRQSVGHALMALACCVASGSAVYGLKGKLVSSVYISSVHIISEAMEYVFTLPIILILIYYNFIEVNINTTHHASQLHIHA